MKPPKKDRICGGFKSEKSSDLQLAPSLPPKNSKNLENRLKSSKQQGDNLQALVVNLNQVHVVSSFKIHGVCKASEMWSKLKFGAAGVGNHRDLVRGGSN